MANASLSNSASTRFRSRTGVSTARQAGTTILLDLNRGQYYTLNEVGGRIWDMLEYGASTSDILTRLAQEYDVAREPLEADTTAMLERLQEAKLIEAFGA